MRATSDRVIFRNPTHLWLALGWLVFAIGTAILHFTVAPSSSILMAGGWLLLAALSVVAGRRVATVLTPEELIRRRFRADRIPWSNIQAFEVHENLASRYVMVRTADGKRHQLQWPTETLGPTRDRFVEQLELLSRYWQAHRGPDWRPVLPERAGS